MLKKIILIPCLSLSCFVNAQKSVSHNNLVWFGDFSKTKLSDRWSIYLDLGLRRTQWLDKWSQTLVRAGATYHFSGDISLTAGVAYFNHYSSSFIRPELRGWQQLLFTGSSGRIKWNHRLRSEQRFSQRVAANELEEGYNYNNRFRYQFGIQVAVNRKKIEDRTIYISVSNEIFINSGKEIVNNYFDQNRVSIGIGCKLNEKLNILVSYMKVFAQKSKVGVFENNNVLVINLYHNFDLSYKNRKKET